MGKRNAATIILIFFAVMPCIAVIIPHLAWWRFGEVVGHAPLNSVYAINEAKEACPNDFLYQLLFACGWYSLLLTNYGLPVFCLIFLFSLKVLPQRSKWFIPLLYAFSWCIFSLLSKPPYDQKFDWMISS